MSRVKILHTLQHIVCALKSSICAGWMPGYSSKKSGYQVCAGFISEGSIT